MKNNKIARSVFALLFSFAITTSVGSSAFAAKQMHLMPPIYDLLFSEEPLREPPPPRSLST